MTDNSTVDRPANLIDSGDVDRYRDDWRTVQTGFVDDPEGAVRDADALIGRLVDTITSRITERRAALSAHGPNHDTEQLRQAMHHYRTMFDQLLPGRH
jgi:hypothetical protein